ncbi:hypothetical protein H5T55_02300 [Candidatus Bipolaricaulota bacterium]|nr:hypothetical protein [Candidatus Bipolaricaulota bacterium]
MLRLLAALVGFAIGYIWVRRRAVARFRRRLHRQGLPAELADALAAEYRAVVRFLDLLHQR